MCQSLFGDFNPPQHAGDFLSSFLTFQGDDLGGGAVAGGFLADLQVSVPLCCDLRLVGDTEHLAFLTQLVQQTAKNANELESEAARLREAVERFRVAGTSNQNAPSSFSTVASPEALQPLLAGRRQPEKHDEEWASF